MIFSVIEQILIAFPLVIGAYLTISLLKVPDLSIESAYLFGAVMAFLAKDSSLFLIILSAAGGGICVGFTVSFLNQILHIPFLLAAIVINGLIHGLTQYLLGTSVKSFSLNLSISEPVLLITIAIILIFILKFVLHSQLGYSWAIYGNNLQFFQHHHISKRYVAFSGVMVGHGCAGISGFLFAQSNGFVDITMNVGILLLCLITIMIGKLFISTHQPNLLIPICGVIIFFLIQQFLLRMGLNLKYFNAFQALLILFILSVGHRKQKLTLDHLGV